MINAAFFAILFGSMLTSPIAYASETDGFTLRYEEYSDGIPAIELEINRRIIQATEEANWSTPQCSEEALQHSLKKLFLRDLYGKIEGYINSSNEVPKRRILLSESIYKYIHFYENVPVRLGEMGFGSIINTKIDQETVLIGTDKFGHFMDQGYEYYKILKGNGKPFNESLNEAFALGDQTENGIYGLVTTGVRSYGDLTANYNGLSFWSNLLLPVLPNSNPYLKCTETSENKSHWEVLRPFVASEYIDAAWDEGVNCSQYRSKSYEVAVNSAIDDLKVKMPEKRFDCPILPDACAKLAIKYGKFARRLLNPNCLAEKR